jgi:hypothetical protein
MDFHVNRDSGDPWRPDFHRFVLLFGHSFSDRIKFWSEFELEHSFVEGTEEAGEIALEQAYVDFLVKPWFNLRGGMILPPVGIVNERHEPPSFNGVERPFVETIIIPPPGASSVSASPATSAAVSVTAPISRQRWTPASSTLRTGSAKAAPKDSIPPCVIPRRSLGSSTRACAA